MMIGDDHHATRGGGKKVWRSLLSVLGSNLRMVEKAFASDVDAIDLEDAVAPIRVLDLERRAV
jgi:hypothetical protein